MHQVCVGGDCSVKCWLKLEKFFIGCYGCFVEEKEFTANMEKAMCSVNDCFYMKWLVFQVE